VIEFKKVKMEIFKFSRTYTKAIVCASGPSLSLDQILQVKNFKREYPDVLLIVVNDTYRLFVDYFDVLYCADIAWLKHHEDDLSIRIDSSLCGAKIVMPDRPLVREYQSRLKRYLVPCFNYQGLYSNFDAINCGRNSGFQAVHLARNSGAKSIILLGFDMSVSPQDGKEHWFGSHPKELRSPVSEFDSFISHFRTLALDAEKEGLSIINCTGPNSKLNGIFQISDFSSLMREKCF
jgi:hypothetical protein